VEFQKLIDEGDVQRDSVASAESSIEASRQKLLREVSGSPDLTFISHTLGNIGDYLIQAGTRQLLSRVSYREVKFRWSKAAIASGNRRKRDIRGLQRVRGHTALVTGGGGWCGPYHRTMPTVLPIIERRFERVLVLPSSVDTSVPRVRKTLARTNALFFARERESYRQLDGLCETDIAHDCAFFFDFGPYRRNGRGVLTAYRTDAESAMRRELPTGNNDISVSCKSLDEWLWTIARHEVVETDRAHVIIAAAMLGKQVRYRAGSYHKVPAITEYALEGFPITRLDV
jgi:exopolysaccharide biosynthesis predicted pyruvyltransferase EpsI